MRQHLLKVTAFAAAQLLLALLFYSFTEPQRRPSGEEMASEERLRLTLHDLLYRRWRTDTAILDRAVQQGVSDIPLRETFETCIAVDDCYMTSIIDKDRQLRQAPGKRLILVGGSNVAFGVDGPLLAERYQMTPVNLGLHELLRAGYMLRHTQANARSGDVVILCLELGTMFSGAAEADPKLRAMVCNASPSMAAYFDRTGERQPWREYGDKLAFAHGAERARSAVMQLRQAATRKATQLSVHGLTSEGELRQQFQQQFDNAWPAIAQEYFLWLNSDTVYARSGFNRYGDFVGHYGLKSNRAIETGQLSALSDEQLASLSKSIAVLNEFIDECHAKEVAVYFAYPPLCDVDEQFTAQYEEAIHAQLHAPTLTSIDAARTDIAEHYDSAYHLNWNGICRRMQIWTVALDRHLPAQVALTPEQHVARRDQRMRTRLAGQSSPGVHMH